MAERSGDTQAAGSMKPWWARVNVMNISGPTKLLSPLNDTTITKCMGVLYLCLQCELPPNVK